MGNQAELSKIDIESAPIAGTALEVSRLALGTWPIGGWMCWVTHARPACLRG